MDARATTISSELLQRITGAMRGERGPSFGGAWFSDAIFTGGAEFRGAIFTGGAEFSGATFTDGAWFAEAIFTGDVWFSGVTFTGGAEFNGAAFIGGAEFSGATFTRGVWFSGVTFTRGAQFRGVTFTRGAGFSGAAFTGGAEFGGAVFESAEQLDLLSATSVSLTGAQFARQVVVEVSAARLECEGTRFDAGAVVLIHRASAAFQRAVFGAPSAITADDRPFNDARAAAEQRLGITGGGPPEVVSLEGVDTADLVVTDLDLTRCRFAGAHHLDKLRLEGDCRFAHAPAGVRAGWTWPPVWRWTRRQVLAEECDRRSAGPRPAGWPPRPPGIPALNAKRVTALYRDLRKAMEDSKNEPGAADFYYGEMEMRRHDPAAPRVDRLILLLYWLASGYGIRATRALMWLAALIAAASLVLTTVGFTDPRPGFWLGVLYAAQCIVSLDSKLAILAWPGELVRLVLRLLGPLLIGLALLAMRNRVKR